MHIDNSEEVIHWIWFMGLFLINGDPSSLIPLLTVGYLILSLKRAIPERDLELQEQIRQDIPRFANTSAQTESKKYAENSTQTLEIRKDASTQTFHLKFGSENEFEISMSPSTEELKLKDPNVDESMMEEDCEILWEPTGESRIDDLHFLDGGSKKAQKKDSSFKRKFKILKKLFKKK